MLSLPKLAALSLAALAVPVLAQEAAVNPVDVRVETRADYTVDHPDDDSGTLSGFHGRYLNLKVDGKFADGKVHYSWRQRMNKSVAAANDLFAAADWAYVGYSPDNNWTLEAGKQVVLVGGYEYDAPPIDVYFSSMFWNNFACYQFGASASYRTDDRRHMFAFQVSNSPYTNTSGQGHAYNLYWSGSMGCLSTMWSVNMFEYVQGKFVNYISLGNRIAAGDFALELDVMNRTVSARHFFDHNYSVVSKAQYAVTPWMTVFVKGGYDELKLDPASVDYAKSPFYGAGFEFFPVRGTDNVRLHALCNRTGNVDGVKTTELNVGVTWRVSVYHR